MDVAPAKAQGSLNPEVAGFQLPLAPSSRRFRAVPKLHTVTQQPCLGFASAKITGQESPEAGKGRGLALWVYKNKNKTHQNTFEKASKKKPDPSCRQPRNPILMPGHRVEAPGWSWCPWGGPEEPRKWGNLVAGNYNSWIPGAVGETGNFLCLALAYQPILEREPQAPSQTAVRQTRAGPAVDSFLYKRETKKLLFGRWRRQNHTPKFKSPLCL